MTLRQPDHKQVGWPRCRWCHEEIKPSTAEELLNWQKDRAHTRAWYHVTNEQEQCLGRTNVAEPLPDVEEEPFMAAAWEFVGRYRHLRRSFRELSQSRASAIRRMRDYQELVDQLIKAYAGQEQALDAAANTSATAAAIKALRDYRRNQLAAGWR